MVEVTLISLLVCLALILGDAFLNIRAKHELMARMESPMAPPLTGVLKQLGVPLKQYVRDFNSDELLRQAARCDNCAARATCVQATATIGTELQDDDFPITECPNRWTVTAYLQRHDLAA